MKSRLALFGVTVLSIIAAGCTTQKYAPIYGGQDSAPRATGQVYTVQPGDTLYSIATRNGLSPRDLMAVNGITDPTTLAVGQVLQLTQQKTAPVQNFAEDLQPIEEAPVAEQNKSEVVVVDEQEETVQQREIGGKKLIWPCEKAELLSGFTSDSSKGIEISGRMGEDIVAAADGRVIYTGSNVKGYGNLIIISHGGNLMTVYGHNSDILVQKGQQVQAGQLIARMGSTGMQDQRKVNLLFEIRYQDKPVDPVQYLP